MDFLEQIKRGLAEVTEIALLLVALAVVAEIIFGTSVAFFGGVVANLTAFISTLGENGFVGLVALAIIVFLFQRKKATV